MTSERRSSHKIIFPLEFCQSEFYTPHTQPCLYPYNKWVTRKTRRHNLGNHREKWGVAWTAAAITGIISHLWQQPIYEVAETYPQQKNCRQEYDNGCSHNLMRVTHRVPHHQHTISTPSTHNQHTISTPSAHHQHNISFIMNSRDELLWLPTDFIHQLPMVCVDK
jgi:hypothetical protein